MVNALLQITKLKNPQPPDGTIETLTARELFIKTGVYKGKDGKYRVEIIVEDAELTTFNNANLYGVIDENGNDVSLSTRASSVDPAGQTASN